MSDQLDIGKLRALVDAVRKEGSDAGLVARIPGMRWTELAEQIDELLDAAEENAKLRAQWDASIDRLGACAIERDALRAEVAKLQLSASDVEFYGNEQVKALRAENERLREALTPSGATKAAYHGEFGFELLARDGEGVDCHMVPWTTIKEIMAAISKRADLRPTEGEVKP